MTGLSWPAGTPQRPAAAEYRTRVQAAPCFAGRAVTSARAASRLLAADPSIHHGEAMGGCVWRAETAACRNARLQQNLPVTDAPEPGECQSSCCNLPYTDRDITTARRQLTLLHQAATDPLAPPAPPARPLGCRPSSASTRPPRPATGRRSLVGGKPRDRPEEAAISAVAGRLLTGTPLRSAGKLTVSGLITESALRRDVVYEHTALAEAFQARVKAQRSTPLAMQQLAAQHASATRKLAAKGKGSPLNAGSWPYCAGWSLSCHWNSSRPAGGSPRRKHHPAPAGRRRRLCRGTPDAMASAVKMHVLVQPARHTIRGASGPRFRACPAVASSRRCGRHQDPPIDAGHHPTRRRPACHGTEYGGSARRAPGARRGFVSGACSGPVSDSDDTQIGLIWTAAGSLK